MPESRVATALHNSALARRVWRNVQAVLLGCGALVGIAAVPLARAGSVAVSEAHVPATSTTGVDVPLTMTIVNQSAQPDALLRVRCPFANFSERHTVDYGEGAPSMRAVTAIPVPAGATVALTTKSYHVMLLQTREPLSEGKALTCSMAFREAGSIEVPVQVAPAVVQP